MKNLILKLMLWCVFHKCKNTPLSVLVEISEGNTKAVKRRFFASKKMIALACGMLQMEFSALCGDNSIKQHLQRIKLHILITKLSELFNILDKTKKHRERIIKKISEITGRKSLEKSIETFESYKQQLEAIEKKIAAKANEKDKDKKDTKFVDLITEIEHHRKFDIDTDKMTIARFASHVKKYKIYCENLSTYRNKKAGK